MGKSVCWNNGDDGYEIDIKKEKIKAEVTLLRQNDYYIIKILKIGVQGGKLPPFETNF